MAVRDCVVVAIEGTHTSGKTTLVHALTAHYRERGVLVACTGEPARSSPFIEEVVIQAKGQFDLVTEVDLFASALSHTLRSTRHHDLLICDKTIVNVLAYARMFLRTPPRSDDCAVLDAMAAFCQAWAYTYDAVFYLSDQYQQATDPLRAKVADEQDPIAQAIRQACADVGQRLLDVPEGLDGSDRVDWVAQRVDPLLDAS